MSWNSQKDPVVSQRYGLRPSVVGCESKQEYSFNIRLDLRSEISKVGLCLVDADTGNQCMIKQTGDNLPYVMFQCDETNFVSM